MKLTPNQWTILEALDQGPRWIRSFQTVKPLVDRLADAGLIERCRPHLGRGRNMIRLTKAGCDLMGLDSVPLTAVVQARAPTVEPAPQALGPIKPGLSDKVQAACEAFVRRVSKGEKPGAVVASIAEQQRVQRPTIWRHLRTAGVLPPYKTGKPLGKRQPALGAVDSVGLPQIVRRDPCAWCGVRGDIGCQHNQTSAELAH